MKRILIIVIILAGAVWWLQSFGFSLRDALIIPVILLLVIAFIRQGIGCLFSRISFFILGLFALAFIFLVLGN